MNMGLAYYRHNETLKRYQEAETPFQKQIIAVTYFEEEAELVNEGMKNKLLEVREYGTSNNHTDQ